MLTSTMADEAPAEVVTSEIRLPLWERQDFETDEQWAAFQHYRNTPAACRTLDRTSAEQYIKRRQIDKWAKTLHWYERARDFDRWMDRQTVEGMAHNETIHETRRAHLRLLGLFSRVLG